MQHDLYQVVTDRIVSAIRYIERLVAETSSDLQKVLDFFGVPALTELTTASASRAIQSLEKSRRAA